MRAVFSFLSQKKLFLLSLLPLKLEAVAQKCSVKRVSLEISEYSQEKTCARVCINIVTGLSCFPVIFAKFLTPSFLTRHTR